MTPSLTRDESSNDQKIWHCNSTTRRESPSIFHRSKVFSFLKLLSSPLVPFFGSHSRRRFISKRGREGDTRIVDKVEATWTASDPSSDFRPETTLIVQTVVGLYLDRYNGDRRVSWRRGEGTVSQRNVVIVFERARYLIVWGLLACPR